MSLFKKSLTAIFIFISLLLLIYISQMVYVKSKKDIPAKFMETQGTRYINYYLNRADYRFSLNNEDLMIERDLKKASFIKDSSLELFLNEWTSYEEKLYPNKECKFVRISIPYGQDSLSDGNIIFTCVDSIATDSFNNLVL